MLTHKLVHRPTEVSELYDLVLDPKELKNVYNDEKYVDFKREMEQQLISWLILTGDVPPLRSDSRGTPKYPNPITEESCMELLQPDPEIGQNDIEKIAADLMKINGIPHFET